MPPNAFESDRLLDQLSRGLMAGVPDAPEEGIASVRTRAIGGTPSSESVSGSRGVVLALTIFLIVAAFVSGLLLGNNPPDPIRDALAKINLPVESVEMRDARESIDSVARALQEKDRSAVAIADPRMMRRLNALETEERKELQPLAEQLHLRALAFLSSS